MPIDYEAIDKEIIDDTENTIKRVTSSLLADLYSNPTHFVYELLQNAEDAKATKVKFRLYQDRLELEHDGQLFNEDDVLSICKLLDSTKSEDLTKIGKFGIGFKSVYAHTKSPKIYSGDAHFAIVNYRHPCPISPPPRSPDLGTLFVFPFDHDEKTPDESFNEISKRLRELGANTLLFLKHIESIEYNIDKEVTGTYLRQTDPVEGTDFVFYITVTGQRNSHDEYDEEERWLVFEKDVTHLADSIPEGKRLTVEIAFQYSDDDSQDTPKFQPPPKSNLIVYFPTEKETHLGFLIQGPYRTTPARDNVKSTEFNQALSEQTGELVVEALRWLQKRNWLTVKILMTMPLQFQRVPPLFEPVYYKVLSAIKDEDLIPAYGGGYVSGKNAKLAGSRELRNLLDNARLRQFCNTDDQLCWASDEITENRTPITRQYLREQVGIEEIDAEKFAGRVGKDFLSCQSDEWMREFYEFASGFGKYSPITRSLKNKPIIRLEDDNHVAPFDRYSDIPNVYLPIERKSQFRTVKTEVCSDKAMEFLRNLGLKKPDIIDEVRKLILPKYNRGEVDSADPEHWQHVETIVKALRIVLRRYEWDSERKELIQDLESTPFLLVPNAEGVEEFCCPEEMIYFRSPELEMYFEGNPDVWFLSSGYETYVDDFKQIGVADQVRVFCKEPDKWGHIRLYRRDDGYDEGLPYHQRGKHGFDPGCSIEGLIFALVVYPNLERAKFIWNHLLIPYQHCIVGTVEYSSRQDFLSSAKKHGRKEQVSKMGELVRETAWLPNEHSKFVVPKTITLDELPDGFSKDKQLAAKLGMKVSYEAIVAELQGRDDIPEELKQDFKLTLELKQECPELLDPEERNRYMRWKEAVAKQPTNSDNSVPGRVDSPGDLRGTVNVPHSGSRTDRQSGETHINNGSQLERHDIEKAAMDAVMQKEKDLGNAPRDVSNSRGLGYDIESHTPEGGSRFIEVKGHSSDDGSVTLTRNEMHCALNNPEQFILALVKVADGCHEPPRYLSGNSWLESVTFSNLRRLLELCQDPS